MITSVNYAAVLVAVVVYMIINALWYGPIWGKKWLELMEVNYDELSDTKIAYLWNTLTAFFMAFVLAHFLKYVGNETVLDGMLTAVWIWLGFVIPTNIMNTIWGRKSKKLFLIDVGAHLISLVSMSILLTLWK